MTKEELKNLTKRAISDHKLSFKRKTTIIKKIVAVCSKLGTVSHRQQNEDRGGDSFTIQIHNNNNVANLQIINLFDTYKELEINILVDTFDGFEEHYETILEGDIDDAGGIAKTSQFKEFSKSFKKLLKRVA